MVGWWCGLNQRNGVETLLTSADLCRVDPAADEWEGQGRATHADVLPVTHLHSRCS